MRLFSFTCCIGSVLTLAGCASSPPDESTSCATGLVACGSGCIAAGAVCHDQGTGATAGTSSVATQPKSSDPVTSCTDVATASGTFEQQYQKIHLTVPGGNKSYFLTSNWWHKYDQQSIEYNGLSFKIVDNKNISVPQTDGKPTGFPALFIGSYEGRPTLGSNLPKAVSELTTIPTVISTNSVSHGINDINASYDVWFTKSASGVPAGTYNPGAGGAFLMVWLFKPTNRQPRGQVGSAGHAVDGVEGTWDVWLDQNMQPPCVSYVSSTPKEEMDFDLAAFIKDAVANNFIITKDMYLSIIFAGFEIWGNGNGLQMKNFCAAVN